MSVQIQPSIFYSQNYLKDECLVAALLEKSSLGCDDLVYEIGPGKGVLTGQLAHICKRVIAIEKDPRLAAWLKQKFAWQPGVTIREGDFLVDRLPACPYKVFANIPFNITSAIVTRLTTAAHLPEDAYLIMQKEAGHMYLGKPDEILRSVLFKPWFAVEILHRFRRRDFVPEPRVDVVMLRLHKRGPPLVRHKNRQLFRDFVVYGFTSWAPTLRVAFKGIFSRQQLKHVQTGLEINLNATPTSLQFEQWLNLFNFFIEVGSKASLRTISGSEKRLIRQQKRLHKIHRTRLAGK
jgi:16S rRNA A1518/A1519 N6-dimethyltransferase RsmA/KsgA/DIM1 with predicted DNA glycosylase/AP lyase activity